MAGIFKADSKGNFNPNVDMTRGEMAKVIATAFNLNVANTGKTSFKDVKANSEYSPYIEALAKANITTGYGDGTFKPTGSLSRSHFAVFMHRAMEFNETGSVTDTDAVTPAPKPVTPPKETPKPVDTNTTIQNGTAVIEAAVGEIPAEIAKYPAELPFNDIEDKYEWFKSEESKKFKEKYDAEFSAKQAKIADDINTEYMNTGRLGHMTQLSLYVPEQLDMFAKPLAKRMEITLDELYQIINWSASTGGVYYNAKGTVYFDFNSAMSVVFGS